MSDYYKGKRSRNLYNTESTNTFKISRSKLDLFLKCPRCFYIDRKLGVGQPPSYPFNLNSAVDALLKKEFDIYRVAKAPHPFFVDIGLDAIPFDHPEIEKWRDSLHGGIQYAVPNTNIMLTGGIDDVWIEQNTQELIIVDYKATSKDGVISLDQDWQIGYKRQVEIYQWLFRKNGFKVSNIAYFVYCNGMKNRDRFDNRLEFEISLLTYIGDDVWVDNALYNAYQCLQGNVVPPHSDDCDYCKYQLSISGVLS